MKLTVVFWFAFAFMMLIGVSFAQTLIKESQGGENFIGTRIVRNSDGVLWKAVLNSSSSQVGNISVYNFTGGTWTEAFSLSRSNVRIDDFAVIFFDTTDPDKLYIIEYAMNAAGNDFAYSRNFTISSQTLADPVPAINDVSNSHAGDAVIDGDNDLWAFSFRDAGGDYIEYVISTNGGQSWGAFTQVVPSRAGNFSLVANGSFIYGVQINRSDDSLIAYRKNASDTWESKALNTTITRDCGFPEINIDANKIHSVFAVQAEGDDNCNLYYSNSSDGFDYPNNIVLIANATDNTDIRSPSIANNSIGRLIVSYHTNDSNAYIVTSVDNGDTWSLPRLLCNNCDGITISGKGNVPASSSNLLHYFARNTTESHLLYNNFSFFPNITIITPTNTTSFTGNASFLMPVSFSLSDSFGTPTCYRDINGTETALGSVSMGVVQNVTTNFTFGTHNVTITCDSEESPAEGNTTQRVFFSLGQASIVSCTQSGSVETLNLTLYDEVDLTQERGDMDVLIVSWVNIDSPLVSTFNFTNTTSEILCVSDAGLELTANVTVEYNGTSGNFPDREYYLINNLINGTSQDVNLYLLDNSFSSLTRITVNDESLIPIQAVTVITQRFYTSENRWRNVSMARTDHSGLSLFRLVDTRTQSQNAFYRFKINDNGNILKTTPAAKLSSDAVTGIIEIVINIEVDVGKAFDIFNKITITCTNTTNNIVCDYSDGSALMSSINLTVTTKPQDQFTFTQVCSILNTSTTGVLNCSIGAAPNGTYIYRVIADFEGDDQVITSGSFNYLVVATLGAIGLLLSAFLISSLMFLMKDQGASAIILSVLTGLIISAMLGFLVIDFLWFGGMIAAGIILVAILRE